MPGDEVTAEIEFTPGVWTDVTGDVQVNVDVTIHHGRNSVLESVGPGTASFTLDNRAGAYTPGHPGGPHYPNVRPNVRLRIAVATVVWFEGYIDAWTPHYPESTADHPVVEVTATDRFRLWSRRLLEDTHTETVQVEFANPALYRMDMASGAVCGDILGGAGVARLVTPRATFAGGTGTVTYGATGPARSTSGVTLTAGTNPQVGDTGYWEFGDSGAPALVVPGTFPLGAAPWTLALWMNVAAYYDRSAADGWAERYTQQVVACNDSVGWSVWLEGAAEDSMYLKLMDEAGTFFATGYIGDVRNIDTHYGIVWDGTDLTVHVNGGSFTTVGGPPGTTATTRSDVTVGSVWMPSRRRTWNTGTVTVSGIVVAPEAADSDQMYALYEACTTGFGGEYPWTRVPRIMGFADVDPGDYVVDNGPAYAHGSESARLGPLDTAGRDLLSLVQETATAEGGVFYIQSDSNVARFADRYSRELLPDFPASTLGTAYVIDQESETTGSEFAAVIEDAQIVNMVTITASDGSTATATDAASITANGLISASDSLLVNSQAQAADAANYRLAQFATPQPRISSVTVDLTTGSGLYAEVLGWRIGQRIRVTGLPETSQPATEFEGYIEGMSGQFGADGDTVIFDLSPVWGWAIQLDADDLGRLDTDGQTVEVACDADDTAITVTEGFSATDAPYDLDIGGERVTVTSAAAASGGQQVLTVTRGVDGTPAVAHLIGTDVYLARNLTLGL